MNINFNAVLCYIEEGENDYPWAFFTTKVLEEQEGNDWNMVPFDVYADIPEKWNKITHRGKDQWECFHVIFRGPLEVPYDELMAYSVKQINAGKLDWLETTARYEQNYNGITIPAGATLTNFIELVKSVGGVVYLPI